MRRSLIAALRRKGEATQSASAFAVRQKSQAHMILQIAELLEQFRNLRRSLIAALRRKGEATQSASAFAARQKSQAHKITQIAELL